MVFETLYGIDVDVKQIRNMMFGFNPFWRPDSGIDTADLKILSNLSHHGSIGEFIFQTNAFVHHRRAPVSPRA